MNRLVLLVIIYFGFTLLLSAQRSKVMGVFQLIEKSKYDEARVILDDAIKRKSTRSWHRTWYARGLLCQRAYRAGIKKNDKAMYELFPEQLYVAFNSFEKTRSLDKRGRYNKKLPPRYVLLANDFMELGEKHYKADEYEKALRAFEYALRIYKSSVLQVPMDTSLIYNASLSAYKAEKWDTAIEYLAELNENEYSSNIPHLLFTIYIRQADTTLAEKILFEGLKNYDDNETIVLLLVDLLHKKNNTDRAVEVLNEAFGKDSFNYIYPYSKGLLYQKNEEYLKAIDAYISALKLTSDSLPICSGIGTCYYNIGADIDEKARTISNNDTYLDEKKKSAEAYGSAVSWFEKALEKDDENQEIIARLNQLYKMLDKRGKLIETDL